jgi:glycosyltransferase involved in cell wall biosynthesis
VANSFFTREALYRIYGVDARVLYLGVDLETFHPLDLPRENMVLSVGALIPRKGFDFVVESLERIPKHLQPALVVVSNYEEPAERVYLEELAAARGVALRVRTRVSTDELVHLYNAAVCTVYAPIMEPFGLVPLESMACGTPVVAVKEGGVRESILHGQTGLLTNRHAEQFAAAIRTLLENEELAGRYGEQARQYVLEHWSWGEAVQRLERHLAQVANHNLEEIEYE